nr:MAG TPA: Spherulation-specific family 4 [Caudoviricetes sp.]
MQSADSALGTRIDSLTSTVTAAASKADAAVTREDLASYPTSATVAETYATKASLEDYLPKTEAAGVYATKSDLANAQLSGKGEAPDLSHLATKAEMTSADAALGQRIDQVKATSDAAAPMSALAPYLTASDAQTTYATKAEVASAAPDLSTYATKESLSGYLTSTSAAETYSTKKDLDSYKGQATSAFAPASLAGEVASVKETADAALPKDVAATTYATKEELTQAQLTGDGKIPDLSGYVKSAQLADYATKAELSGYAKSASLAPISAKADAALPKSEAADTYAAKADLAGYATAESVSSAYATKEALTSATAPVADLSSKVAALEASVQGKADSSALADLLPKAEASTTYATKDEVTSVRAAIPEAPDLSGYLTAESATATYATKADVEGVRSSIPAAPDLSAYLTYDAASKAYATKADLAQAQAGGKVDLSGYMTTADADGKYATKEALSAADAKVSEASAKAATAVQPDALSAYATTEALAKVKQAAEAAAEAVAPPFRSGERYSSPVTYYWPDYYNESKGTSKWAKALKAAGTLGIVILNKDSGNWDEKNEDFGKQASQALAAGARRAVFYVKTQYGVASLPSNDPARAGVPNPDKYTKEYILGQIAKFTEQYGEVAQGVFLDETINGWGAQAGRVQWYKDLIAAIREQYGQNFYIVVNAGSNMSPEMCALDFDTAMMFEQDAGKFLNEDANAPVLPDHMRSYPSEKWWAVIHGVTKDNYRQVFEKLDTLPIGHAYITDGVLVEDPNRGGQWEPVGNPYANPPSEQLIRLTSSWIRGTLGLHLEVEDLKAQLEALKKAGAGAPAGAGQAGKLLVLGPNDPLPQGVTDDTVIVRREA